MKDLKKVKKSEKVQYIQHHFSGRTNNDPAPIKRKDSECSANTSSDEDCVSEIEDVVLNDNPLSTNSSSPDDNDGYDEENEHTTEQRFTVTRSIRTALTYKRADYLY